VTPSTWYSVVIVVVALVTSKYHSNKSRCFSFAHRATAHVESPGRKIPGLSLFSVLQALLGHANLVTAARYLHPVETPGVSGLVCDFFSLAKKHKILRELYASAVDRLRFNYN